MTEVPVLSLDTDQVTGLMLRQYGLRARTVEFLGAEAAVVCRVTTEHAVLAVKVMTGDRDVNRWHGEVLAGLAGCGLPVPEVVPDRSGAVTSETDGLQIQVTSWLPGEPLASVAAGPGLLRDIGQTAARLRIAMAAAPMPPRPVTHTWELTRSGSSIRDALATVTDARTGTLATRALNRFSREVVPFLGDLPRAVVHHDLHDSNLLTATGRSVSGILDFGDTVYGLRVAELAVAAAYAARSNPDPADALLEVVAGWTEAAAGHPDAMLTGLEYQVLYPAAIVRLAVNAAVWASRFDGPRGDYARSRVAGSLDAVERLLAVAANPVVTGPR